MVNDFLVKMAMSSSQLAITQWFALSIPFNQRPPGIPIVAQTGFTIDSDKEEKTLFEHIG